MNYRKLLKNRQFSDQIRRQAVKEFRCGQYTVIELAQLYQCCTQTIYNWIYKYSPADAPAINVVEMSDSSDQKLKELTRKIEHLERALGQKQMQVDFYKKMVELAEAEYDLDLKKNLLRNPRLVPGTPAAARGEFE